MNSQPLVTSISYIQIQTPYNNTQRKKKFQQWKTKTKKQLIKGTWGKRVPCRKPKTSCPFHCVKNGTTVKISKLLDQNKTGLFPVEGWVQHWIYCLFSCPHYIHFGLILIYYERWCRKEARSYYPWSSIIATNELFLFIVVIQDRDQWVISSLLNFTNPYFGIYILTWYQKHRKSIL